MTGVREATPGGLYPHLLYICTPVRQLKENKKSHAPNRGRGGVVLVTTLPLLWCCSYYNGCVSFIRLGASICYGAIIYLLLATTVGGIGMTLCCGLFFAGVRLVCCLNN